MKYNKTLFIILIVVLTTVILQKLQKPNKIIKKIIVKDQHPRYPFVQYDIRETLAPSRRTYMRYPYYASRYGMYMR